MAREGPLLITGFEPFDGHRLNVSWEVARHLQGESVGPTSWIAIELPCRFGACIDALHDALTIHQPRAVLSLGQAEGRSAISLERLAINVRDARIADNGGAQPIDEAIVDEAPYAYPTRLPLRRLLTACREAGHAVELSNTAGTFVCNDLFYGLMHRTRDHDLPAGFIHLPILPDQQRSAAARSPGRDDAPDTGEHTPTLALAQQLATLRLIGELIATPSL